MYQTMLRTLLTATAVFMVAPTVDAASNVLPLRRVRLYETGVGYFERGGLLHGGVATLPVPASHLDDALKTMVVFSDDKDSKVRGVEFGSSVSQGLAQALAGLGPGEGRAGILVLLRSLKGTSISVRTDEGTLRGRLVEVENAEQAEFESCDPRRTGVEGGKACVPQKRPAIIMVTEAGELRRIAIEKVIGVRPNDRSFATRLGAALDTLSEGSAQLIKELRVMAQSNKAISLGYVSETPVYRTNYRLVLGDAAGEEALLQGWALLHNDTDEPWQKVTVELVNGRPDSFLFPLAAPRYARRQLVTPDEALSTLPQLLTTTVDGLWEGEEDSFGSGGLGLSGIGEGGGGRGEGIGVGAIGTLGHGGGKPGDSPSSVLSVGNLSGVVSATATESGVEFRYALGCPLDLRAHGSALVPFVATNLTAQRVSTFDQPGEMARSAVHLIHHGKQTLPAGTLSVFSDGGFAGESGLPRLKPDQSATVEFGHDQDVELTQMATSRTDTTQLLTYAKGGLVEHFIRRHVIQYRIDNRSASARTVFLKLDYVQNSRVEGADQLAHDVGKDRDFAGFDLNPRQSLTRTIEVKEGLSRTLRLNSVNRHHLRQLAESASLPTPQKRLLLEAAGILEKADTRRAQRRNEMGRLAALENDIERMAKHVGQFRQAPGAETLVAKVVADEERARTSRARVRRLRLEEAALRRRAVQRLGRLGQ